MSTLSDLVGAAVGNVNPVTGPVNSAAGLINAAHSFLGLFKVDDTVKAQITAQLTEANIDLEKSQLAQDLAVAQGQIETNKIEAASTKWFVAGWRPYIGWVCGTGLLYAILVQPLLTFVLLSCGVHLPTDQLPKLDLTQILAILSPMMGLGIARTVEKVTGTEGNR